MDLMSAYLPPSPEKTAMALKAFYAKDRELWAGCIWWKIYEVMTRKDVLVVTDRKNLELSTSAGLKTHTSLEDAFREALACHGPDARVAFVPYGRYSVLGT
jgi:hypothetical protein